MTARTKATSIPEEWEFLAGWFAFLGTHGITSSSNGRDSGDAIRADLDGDSAPWVHAHLEHNLLDPGDDESYGSDQGDGDNVEILPTRGMTAGMRSLREALVLTSLVGKVDRHAWLTMMVKYGHFQPARPSTVRKDGQSLPRFRMDITQTHSVDFLDWTTSLRNVFGDQYYGKWFMTDLRHAQQILQDRGIEFETIEPTPIQLVFSLRDTLLPSQDAGRRLMLLVEAIQRMQLQEQQAQVEPGTTSCATLFRVVSLEIDLRGVEMDGHVLQALHPSELPVATPLSQWGAFVRLIAGIDLDLQGRLASVRRLVVPTATAASCGNSYYPYVASLCSALAFCKGVEDVCFSGLQDQDDSGTDHSMMWCWLAFAFFSRASSTSVKILTIDGMRISHAAIVAIQPVSNSADPLRLLSEHAFGHNSSGTSTEQVAPLTGRPQVRINSRDLFRVANGSGGGSWMECQHSSELIGELLPASYAGGQEGWVFIPGYAFCLPQSLELLQPPSPSPSPRVSPRVDQSRVGSSSLQALVLRSHDGYPMIPSAVHGILEVVGSRLRGLKLDMASNEEVLQSVFALCPKLNTLALSRMSFPTMEIIDEAYSRGVKISTLSLDRMIVPEQSMDKLLRKLVVTQTTERSMADTLERLYLGSSRESETQHALLGGSPELLEDVVKRNETLTHLVVMCSHSQSLSAAQQLGALGDHHGVRIPGISRMQKKQRMEFLGAMWSLSTANSDLHVDSFVADHIWQFAVTPRYRAVSWASDSFDQD